MNNLLLLLALMASTGAVSARPLEVTDSLNALEPAWRVPLSVSADGQRVAYCLTQPSRKQPMLEVDHYRSQTGAFAETIGCDIWVVDARTGEYRNLTDGKGTNFAPVWSPTEDKLAFLSDRDGAVRLWIYDEHGLRRVSPEIAWMGVGFDTPTWTPDGKQVVLKLLPSDLTVAEAAALQHPAKAAKSEEQSAKRNRPPRVYSYKPGQLAEDSHQETPAGWPADLVTVDINTGRSHRLVPNCRTCGWWVSPDGRYLAYTSMDGRMSATEQVPAYSLNLLDLSDNSDKVLIPRYGSDFGRAVSWSPDSRRMAVGTMSGAMDYEFTKVMTVDLDGNVRTLTDTRR